MARGKQYICDVCGRPGEGYTAGQKRHAECRNEMANRVRRLPRNVAGLQATGFPPPSPPRPPSRGVPDFIGDRHPVTQSDPDECPAANVADFLSDVVGAIFSRLPFVQAAIVRRDGTVTILQAGDGCKCGCGAAPKGDPDVPSRGDAASDLDAYVGGRLGGGAR